ncbi:MAG: hypothetical protein Kow0099_24630 [Candidatus Abyssubacteria bacterium]
MPWIPSVPSLPAFMSETGLRGHLFLIIMGRRMGYTITPHSRRITILGCRLQETALIPKHELSQPMNIGKFVNNLG